MSKYQRVGGPERWSRAELRLAERYARALVKGEFRSARQAAARAESDFEFLRHGHPDEVWAQKSRSFVTISDRIAKLAHRTLGRWASLKWTRGEDHIILRYARDAAAGRYRQVKDAARACREEFLRLGRQQPKPPWLSQQRTQVAIYNRMLKHIRKLGLLPRHDEWSPEESRVLDTYARALARGKFRKAREALVDLKQELERLRRRYPDANWLRVQRRPSALLHMLRIRARALGRPIKAVAWSPAERRLLDDYARGVVSGKYPNATYAARLMLSRMAQLRSRRPAPEGFEVVRGFKAAKGMLWARSHAFGRPLLVFPWSAEELKIVDRYGRALGRGDFKDLHQAARAAVGDLARLHEENPHESWSRVHRTWKATRLRMWYRVHDLGLLWTDRQWTAEEKRILERYARMFMAGRYRKMMSAAGDCQRELTRRYNAIQRRRFGQAWAPQPRSLTIVYERLRMRTSALGRPRISNAWRPAELRLARKWARRSAVPRSKVTATEASRQLRSELRRSGFNRGPATCHAQVLALRKKLRSRTGARGASLE
jgi:hypothetical protein